VGSTKGRLRAFQAKESALRAPLDPERGTSEGGFYRTGVRIRGRWGVCVGGLSAGSLGASGFGARLRVSPNLLPVCTGLLCPFRLRTWGQAWGCLGRTIIVQAQKIFPFGTCNKSR
jgi:hypothetical protein